MRILIYSYNYHPEPIGIAPLMTELAEGLVAKGHQVRVVTGLPNYPEREIYPQYRGKFYCTERINGVKIQRCYLWVRKKPGLVDRIMMDVSFVATSFIQAFNGWRPDVILLTIPALPIAVPAALLGWIYRCPVVLNLQDILPEAAVQVGLLKNKWLIRISAALEKFAYRTANQISVIADGFVENLQGKNVASDKITLIPNWVNVDFIKPLPKQENPFRQAHGLEGKFVVLYSGNIALTQDIRNVVRSATFVQHIPDIIFVIVGEESALQKLQDFCDTEGVTNVLLLPFQEREKLPQMLAAADVGLVMQKKNVIGFNMPSKIQVLLASGRAIIASVPLTGTAAHAIEKSGGGVVVPPEDPAALAEAILDLYHHPEKSEQLGFAGRKHAEALYNYDLALKRYESLFLEVLSR